MEKYLFTLQDKCNISQKMWNPVNQYVINILYSDECYVLNIINVFLIAVMGGNNLHSHNCVNIHICSTVLKKANQRK